MSKYQKEKVLSVHHWNDSLFSFTTTRRQGLRFRNGHFLMIGLEVEVSPWCGPIAWSVPTTKSTWNF